eukprot:1161783-Pelagomonas_calceolata.AAC.1
MTGGQIRLNRHTYLRAADIPHKSIQLCPQRRAAVAKQAAARLEVCGGLQSGLLGCMRAAGALSIISA